VVFFLINLIAIGGSIISGYHRGKLAYRFEEKQAMTYFSSNQLAGTALMAWATYLAHRKLLKRDPRKNRSVLFWALSALGFFFLMMDESFQIHEGFDNFIAHGGKGGHTNAGFDGLATLGYGIVAAGVCYYFRAELLRYRRCLIYYAIGGVFLVLTSVLDIGDESQLQIVIEETCKILGVVAFLMAYLGAFIGSLEEAGAAMRSAPAEVADEIVQRTPERIRRAAQG
jgi:hypothetical protein